MSTNLAAWLSAKSKLQPTQSSQNPVQQQKNRFTSTTPSEPSEYTASETTSIYPISIHLYSSTHDDARSIFSSRPAPPDDDTACKVKDASDTRSVRTAITTCTVLGKPHRMQWRGASRHVSAESGAGEEGFGRGRLRGEDASLMFEEEDVETVSASLGLREPTAVVRMEAHERVKRWEELSDENHRPTSSSGSFMRSFEEELRMSGFSDMGSKPHLKQYVRPSALEIAREGWIFYQSESAAGWEKVFAVATYQPIVGTGVLHIYESQDDLHPSSVMDLANLGSVSSNGVVSHLPETSLEPLNLHTLSISIPSNSIHIATVSTAERDAWIYALKAMRSSSQAVTATPSNPPRYTSETDETLQIQLQQSQERIAQLEAKLAARNDTGTDAGGSCASATSSDIVALIDAKMAEIMEAIWAAHSTSSRTAETVHATVLTREESDTDVEARLSTIGDVEVAIQDLTESMEMRTSRIGKMVHELLPVKDDVKRIVAAIEGQQGAGLVGVPDPNGVNLLKRVIEDQKSISNDVGTLLSIAAESSLAQRVAWDELSREAKERHNALKQTFLGMSAEPGLRKCIEDLLQDDFVRSKFTETIRSIFLDLKCSLSDRSPEGSDSNGGGSATMDEILHEKLDNINEVIDFVNKSQCRLVDLVTEKMKCQPSSSSSLNRNDLSAKFDYEKLNACIKEAVVESIGSLQDKMSIHSENQHSSLSSSPSRQTLISDTVDAERASSRALHTLIMESLANMEGQLTRSARDVACRQELVEVWMERNHESLKLIQRGVNEVEKMERAVSPARGVSNNSNPDKRLSDAELELFLSRLEKRAGSVLENLVSDVKEVWTKRQERVNGDIEALFAEKVELQQQVCLLSDEKNKLETEIERLQCLKQELGGFEPMRQAMYELEKDLMDRAGSLVTQIEELKQERVKLKAAVSN